jgi:inosose dehydratase
MQSSTPSRTTTIPIRDRIAGAPISWGVCEVPGWGFQFGPDRVFGEMKSLGLAATEFGPVGFLADDPADKAAQLAAYGLQAVGGFLPVLLHDPGHDPVPEVDAFIDGCLAAGGGVVVLAASTGVDGYDARPGLDDLGWKTMLSNLDRLADLAASRGVVAALHPHIGTMVENGDEVQRVVAGSHVGLCIDTGHLAVAGTDPVALTTAHAPRVTHVHLKDVDETMAQRVVVGDLAFGAAVRAGIFRPLGQGDIDIAALVRALEGAGYQGWYVLEQDVMLDDEPEGIGPVADVRACLDFLLGAVA